MAESPEQNGYDPNQQEQENAQEALRRTRRVEGYEFISMQNTPEAVAHYAREYSLRTVEQAIRDEIPPNDWTVHYQVLPRISDRIGELKRTISMGVVEPDFEDISAGLVAGEHNVPEYNPFTGKVEPVRRIVTSKLEAFKKRMNLAGALEKAKKEVLAFATITKKHMEMEAYSGDEGNYLVRAFLQLGKTVAHTRHYPEILNAAESEEGMDPFGEKVERAFNKLVEVAEGKAVVKTSINGREELRHIPNPFAMKRNWGALQLALAYTSTSVGFNTEPVIGELTEENVDQHDKFQREYDDNYRAALTALLLFRHWDLDVYYQLGYKGFERNVGIKELAPEDIRNIDIEGSYADSYKVMFFEMRRAGEFRGSPGLIEGRRLHPRKCGTPLTLGCYPMLTSHALDIMGTDIVVNDGRGNFKKEHVSIFRAVFGDKDGNGVIKRDGRNWYYGRKKLGDRTIWDNVSYFDTSAGETLSFADPRLNLEFVQPEDLNEEQKRTIQGRVTNLVIGASTNEFEQPYKLQGYYAAEGLYGQASREDYKKQYDEFVKTDALKKLNKQIDLGLMFMTRGMEISQNTGNKLNEYTRAVLIAGLLAAVVSNEGEVSGQEGAAKGNKLESRRLIDKGESMSRNKAMRDLMASCARNGFLGYTGSEEQIVDEKYKNFFHYVLDNRDKRGVPTPHELKDIPELAADWGFSENELTEIDILYPIKKQ